MGTLRSSLCLLLLTLACSANSAMAPSAARAAPPELQELENLRAFARLYGVLRFFHPSDEAAALDWNRYAVLGVARVRVARDSAELEAALEAIVLPIAPTVRILGVDEVEKATLLPPGDVLVAWQHRGPGFDVESTGSYQSRRTGRADASSEELFAERASAGEVAEVRLGGGLLAQVPLAVLEQGRPYIADVRSGANPRSAGAGARHARRRRRADGGRDRRVVRLRSVLSIFRRHWRRLAVGARPHVD